MIVSSVAGSPFLTSSISFFLSEITPFGEVKIKSSLSRRLEEASGSNGYTSLQVVEAWPDDDLYAKSDYNINFPTASLQKLLIHPFAFPDLPSECLAFCRKE